MTASAERGSALIVVLWLVAVLAASGGVGFMAARAFVLAGRNRIQLARLSWAAEACVNLSLTPSARADLAYREPIQLTSTVWCRLRWEIPGARINVNRASPAVLQRLFGAEHADPLIDWRDADNRPEPDGAEASWYKAHHRPLPRNGPMPSISELRLVRGFDRAADSASLWPLLTVDGDGRVDLNQAPRAVLIALPGLGSRGADAILGRRAAGQRVTSLDEIAGWLSPDARESFAAGFPDLSLDATTDSQIIVAHIEAGAAGTALRVRVKLVLASRNGRSAVVRRGPE